jgi:hypothetical protein
LHSSLETPLRNEAIAFQSCSTVRAFILRKNDLSLAWSALIVLSPSSLYRSTAQAMFGDTWAFASSIVVLAQVQSTSSHRIIRDFSARLRGFLMIIMQRPARPFATLHRPAPLRLRVTRKQQDVVLPLMITLRMVMRSTFAQRQPQGALTDEKHLGQDLFLLPTSPSAPNRHSGPGCAPAAQPVLLDLTQ